MNQIKRWDNGIVICEGEESIKDLAVKSYADLRYADLRFADLSFANLRFANLRFANLSSANLRFANLSSANLRSADLRSANLRSADLSSANLRFANLRSADLSSANLRFADLRSADLRSANLRSADLSSANLRSADLSSANLRSAKNIEFYRLPSLATLAKITLFNLPDDLQLELMRRDAQAHPHPELFDEWVKTGKCPYVNEERFWLFEPKPKLWKPGKPEMNDFDLIIAICKSQGWKIRE